MALIGRSMTECITGEGNITITGYSIKPIPDFGDPDQKIRQFLHWQGRVISYIFCHRIGIT
jgi:hypothetical protein